MAERTERTLAGVNVGPNTRVITYVSRGFESMRGFDVFMRAAKRIAQEYPDVAFVVVGSDRIAYGGDENFIAPHKTFKEWVLAQDNYDLSNFVWVGRLPQEDLGLRLAVADVYKVPADQAADEMLARRERWSPYCSVAARVLWLSRRKAMA